MGYNSNASIHITGGFDPSLSSEQRDKAYETLPGFILGALDTNEYSYEPDSLEITESPTPDIERQISFDYEDAKLYELGAAILNVAHALHFAGWIIDDIAASRQDLDTDELETEIWSLLPGGLLASNFEGPIGNIDPHKRPASQSDGQDDPDGIVVYCTNFENQLRDSITERIGAAKAAKPMRALSALGIFDNKPLPMTRRRLNGIVDDLLGLEAR